MTLTDDSSTVEPTQESVETRWTRVCSIEQLIPERGLAALVGTEPVALFLLEDETVHAVGHRDPFSNANVMARGIIGSVGAGDSYRDTVASPMYKQVFDLATGECLTEPGPRLPVHPVRIVDGHVEVGDPAKGGGP
jgi:nitrite reductase (NADH) small subunit